VALNPLNSSNLEQLALKGLKTSENAEINFIQRPSESVVKRTEIDN